MFLDWLGLWIIPSAQDRAADRGGVIIAAFLNSPMGIRAIARLPVGRWRLYRSRSWNILHGSGGVAEHRGKIGAGGLIVDLAPVARCVPRNWLAAAPGALAAGAPPAFISTGGAAACSIPMFRLRIVQGRRQIAWGRPIVRRRGCNCSRKQLRLARQDPVAIRARAPACADRPNMSFRQAEFTSKLQTERNPCF